MSNEKKSGFNLPPRRQGAVSEEAKAFIEGAGNLADPEALAQSAPATQGDERGDTPAEYPWDGVAQGGRRFLGMNLNLNEFEHALLGWVYENKQGVKSKHQYVLRAVQERLMADTKELTGRDVTLEL